MDELEHIRKWPPEHWKLAFQGQIRTSPTPTPRCCWTRMRARRGGARPVSRAEHASRALPPEMRLAGGAAAALVLTMVLPWYQSRRLGRQRRRRRARALAGLLLGRGRGPAGRAGVLYLVWARAQRKGFHLPGGDGTVIMAAGGWAVLLLRLAAVRQALRQRARARPSASSGASSSRCSRPACWWPRARACAPPGRPEPPNPTADEPGLGAARRPRASRRERASRGTGARASTPRSRRCCASGRRLGRRAARGARRAGGQLG